MSSKSKVSAAEVRKMIARNLDACDGKVPVHISAVIGQMRSKFPCHRLNDAEVTHLIAEGAVRRGLDINFDAGSQANAAGG